MLYFQRRFELPYLLHKTENVLNAGHGHIDMPIKIQSSYFNCTSKLNTVIIHHKASSLMEHSFQEYYETLTWSTALGPMYTEFIVLWDEHYEHSFIISFQKFCLGFWWNNMTIISMWTQKAYHIPTQVHKTSKTSNKRTEVIFTFPFLNKICDSMLIFC